MFTIKITTILFCASQICVQCFPVTVSPSQSFYPNRLDIYKRQNSEFNRLPTNSLNYAPYKHIIDKPPNSNYYATTPSQINRINQRVDASNGYADTEDRRLKKKRPCIPVSLGNYYKKGRNSPQAGNGRTLWDLNFYFLGYQPTEATIPIYEPEFIQTQYDTYGGYTCIPNPDYKPHHHHHHGNQFGSSSTYGDTQQPSGGPLGFFGQGGLLNFFNNIFGSYSGGAGGGGGGGAGGGGDIGSPISPVASHNPSSSFLEDEEENRPVYEVNVPDTIQSLVS